MADLVCCRHRGRRAGRVPEPPERSIRTNPAHRSSLSPAPAAGRAGRLRKCSPVPWTPGLIDPRWPPRSSPPSRLVRAASLRPSALSRPRSEAIGYVGSILVLVGMVAVVQRHLGRARHGGRPRHRGRRRRPAVRGGALVARRLRRGGLARAQLRVACCRPGQSRVRCHPGRSTRSSGAASRWRWPSAAIVAAYSFGLWQLKDRPAQQLTTFAGLLVNARWHGSVGSTARSRSAWRCWPAASCGSPSGTGSCSRRRSLPSCSGRSLSSVGAAITSSSPSWEADRTDRRPGLRGGPGGVRHPGAAPRRDRRRRGRPVSCSCRGPSARCSAMPLGRADLPRVGACAPRGDGGAAPASQPRARHGPGGLAPPARRVRCPAGPAPMPAWGRVVAPRR